MFTLERKHDMFFKNLIKKKNYWTFFSHQVKIMIIGIKLLCQIFKFVPSLLYSVFRFVCLLEN